MEMDGDRIFANWLPHNHLGCMELWDCSLRAVLSRERTLCWKKRRGYDFETKRRISPSLPRGSE